jgi:hypothetical protein
VSTHPDWSTAARPRLPSPGELELLERVLEDAGDDQATLQRQARAAYVVAACACGCGALRLAVDCALPPAGEDGEVATAFVPIENEPRTARAFVERGYLSRLELGPVAG